MEKNNTTPEVEAKVSSSPNETSETIALEFQRKRKEIASISDEICDKVENQLIGKNYDDYDEEEIKICEGIINEVNESKPLPIEVVKSLISRVSSILSMRTYNNITKEYSFSKNLNKSIAKKLIEAGEAFLVTQNICLFQESDNAEIAKMLNDAGKSTELVCALKNFKEITKEDAIRLLENALEEYVGLVAKFPDKLLGFTNNEIALKLLEKRRFYDLALNLDKLKDLSLDVAYKLIEVGGKSFVEDNIQSFKEQDKFKEYIKSYQDTRKRIENNISNRKSYYYEGWQSEYDFASSILEDLKPYKSENDLRILFQIMIEKGYYDILFYIAKLTDLRAEVGQMLTDRGKDVQAERLAKSNE
jgi:hypothetical protein